MSLRSCRARFVDVCRWIVFITNNLRSAVLPDNKYFIAISELLVNVWDPREQRSSS